MKKIIIKQSLGSFLYLIIVLFLVNGCAKSENTDDPPAPNDKQYDVYIAGYESNGNHLVAKYWKNGIEMALTDGTYDAEAMSICVAGDNIYVAGYESNGKKKVAKYWKNGMETSLTDGSHDACANCILKINNDLHIVGTEGDFNPQTFNRQPVHWKNGVPTVLSVGKVEGVAQAIVTDGDNIYILIRYINDRGAGYWKNDSYYSRVTDPLDAITNCIAVDNGNVYIAGIASYFGPTRVATLWENGHPTKLSDDKNLTDANACAIAIERGDIYVGGYENGKAKYWKNGIPYTLPNGQKINAIFVDNENVFAAGDTRSSGGKVIKFWKNMTETSITDGNHEAGVNAMTVTTGESTGDDTNNPTLDDGIISTVEELKILARNVNDGNSYEGKTLLLANDLDLKGCETNLWTPIGAGVDYPFKGTFDGNNKKISNLFVTVKTSVANTEAFAGLFGYCEGATLKNIIINGGHVSSSFISGGVCALAIGTTIANCTNRANISAATSGGICGIMSNLGIITDCTNSASVSTSNTNDAASGGICGFVTGATVTNSTNSGSVFATAGGDKMAKSGGIFGQANSATIIGCINRGNISATANVTYTGGLGGVSSYSDIFCCVNSGTVEANGNTTNKGEFMGQFSSDHISACSGTSVSKVPLIGRASNGISNCYTVNATNLPTGCLRYSSITWPTAIMPGWGDTAPVGWDTNKHGVWNKPWYSLGTSPSVYPTLKNNR